MHTAKLIGLTVDEFWDMSPYTFLMLVGYYLESQGKANPFALGYYDD